MQPGLNERVNISLAAYPGFMFHAAMQKALTETPAEPLLGSLVLVETQLCPQNRGILTEDYVAMLRETYPQTRFRLHANVRVMEKRYLADWSSWRTLPEYWGMLARISLVLQAPAYTAHAGRRAQASIQEILFAARAAEEQFGCPVGIEGHYPTKDDSFLISTWEEYRELFESGVRYAVDLSHLNIVAEHSGRHETTLVQEMLACERCLEVHLSGNDGTRDQHKVLTEETWWWPLLRYIHEDSTVFSEGQQHSEVIH